MLWNGDLFSHLQLDVQEVAHWQVKAPALMAVRVGHVKQGIGAKALKPPRATSTCVSEAIRLPGNIHSVWRISKGWV